jgi:hypothetical protein
MVRLVLGYPCPHPWRFRFQVRSRLQSELESETSRGRGAGTGTAFWGETFAKGVAVHHFFWPNPVAVGA